MPRIEACARRFRRDAVSLDDLIQAGRIGLWNAMRAFDPAHGKPFDHLASRAIKRAVRDEARRENRHWKNRASPEEALEPDNEPQTEADYVPDAAAADQLRERLRALAPTLRVACELRYLAGLPQSKVATALGVTQQRVSQIEQQAVCALRSGLTAQAA
jgi:RNA polymerase sigma factor (sigma-70 family)